MKVSVKLIWNNCFIGGYHISSMSTSMLEQVIYHNWYICPIPFLTIRIAHQTITTDRAKYKPYASY